jgi:drug/metabolite transporter (DMT)-like permease
MARQPALPLAALLIGNGVLALGPWFVRLADTGPVSAGFWRVALAVPALFVIARVSGQALGLPSRRVLLAVLAGGAMFGLDVATWHIGIGMTRLANAVLLGNAGSLILMVWGLVALRRWPFRGEWLALAAALGGAAILLGRSLEVSTTTLIGDLFSLLAGTLYAGYLLALTSARRTVGGWTLLAWSSGASALVLLPLALALGEPFWPGAWWPVAGLALSSQIVGQGLLVYALRHFSSLVIGIGLLCQPVVGALVGWLYFGELLGPLDMAGMALVAGALVLAKR